MERQIIELPFFGGLDTKSDSKQIPLGKLLVLQNAVFTSPGKLQKRNGYTALTTNILGGGTISSGAALFTRSNELCMTDTSSNLYSYDQSNTAWVSKGKMPSVTVTEGASVNPQYTCQGIDMAVSGTLQCFVYEQWDYTSSGGWGAAAAWKSLGYAVVDSVTGQVVVPPTTLDSTSKSISPRVVVLGTNFVCYYIQGDLAATAGIFGKTLSTTTPNAAWSAATQLTSGVGTSAQVIAAGAYQIDACVSGTNGYISFNNRGGGTTIFQTTSASPLSVNASTNIAATASRASTVFPDVSGDIVLGYITAAAATTAVYSSSLGVQKLAPAVLDNTLANYSAITGISTATNTVTFFIANVASTQVQQIRKNTLTTASYTVGTASTVIRSLSIGAKAFTYSGAAYCPAWFSVNTSSSLFSRVNDPQNQMLLLDASGNILSKALVSTFGAADTIAGFSTAFYQPCSSVVSGATATVGASISDYLKSTAFPYQIYLNTLYGVVLTSVINTNVTVLGYQYGACGVSFNFSDTTNNYLRGQLANTVHTSGGILQMYDGQNVVEHGFLVYPQGVSAVTAATGTSITSGTRSYAVVYSWPDGQGQSHQSSPSVPVSVTFTAGDKATLTIPTLRATAKTGVLIDIYRTTAGGTIYYKINNFNFTGSLFNDKTVDTVTYQDTLPDGSITGSPQLYVTGGSVLNTPAPPAGAMCVHRNRLFVVDSTSPTQVWFSKLVTGGAPGTNPAPVEFSNSFVLNIDPKGGPITALASLDDKLIIFKSDRIFMVLGQGPDSTGNQNDFTDAILVSSDTGCAVPKSVVVVPDGIMFQSPKGIYQLSRALQVSYIGAPAEFIRNNTSGLITPTIAALLHPYYNRVIFDLGGVIHPVYDTYAGQWDQLKFAGGVDPTVGHSAVDAVMLTSITTNSVAHHVLDVMGVVYQETSGSFADSGTAAGIAVTTGWIKLSGLQGFQRVWRLIVLGDYMSPHTLTVTVAYNYNSAVVQTFTFVVGSDPAPYQFRCHLAQQKCEAIQVTISDSAQSGTGESMSLSGLALEVGLKKGPYRLTAAQSG